MSLSDEVKTLPGNSVKVNHFRSLCIPHIILVLAVFNLSGLPYFFLLFNIILVPRAYDPSGLRLESRALGATISGMRHR